MPGSTLPAGHTSWPRNPGGPMHYILLIYSDENHYHNIPEEEGQRLMKARVQRPSHAA